MLTIPAAPPLVAGATTLPPASLGALWALGRCVIWFSAAAGSACREAAYKTHRPPGRYHNPLNSFNPSRRLVFITDCLKCGMYRDSSPTAQNDCARRESRNADFILIAGGDTTTLSGQRPLSNFRTLRPFGAEPRQPSSLNPGRQGSLIIHHPHRALQRCCPEGCTHFPCRTLSARTSG